MDLIYIPSTTRESQRTQQSREQNLEVQSWLLFGCGVVWCGDNDWLVLNVR